MKLINPEGVKKIIVQDNEHLSIQLEDFDNKSREFILEIELKGNNAKCEIKGRIQTQNKNEKSWNIRQIFKGQDQIGNIEIKGCGENKSKLNIRAEAIITAKSINADANVRERILLFDKAKISALPILTVKTDKVKNASHSASVEQIDENKLLYLQSRGINENQAKELLKEGFLARPKIQSSNSLIL